MEREDGIRMERLVYSTLALALDPSNSNRYVTPSADKELSEWQSLMEN